MSIFDNKQDKPVMEYITDRLNYMNGTKFPYSDDLISGYWCIKDSVLYLDIPPYSQILQPIYTDKQIMRETSKSIHLNIRLIDNHVLIDLNQNPYRYSANELKCKYDELGINNFSFSGSVYSLKYVDESTSYEDMIKYINTVYNGEYFVLRTWGLRLNDYPQQIRAKRWIVVEKIMQKMSFNELHNKLIPYTYKVFELNPGLQEIRIYCDHGTHTFDNPHIIQNL